MVPKIDRRFIRQRAKYLCEYCHSPEYLSPDRFTVDHILPRSLGGSDSEENLALCCHRCNGHHYNFTTGVDPETLETVPLFNPRWQQWVDHFIWSVDGLRVIGITAVGRATCDRLRLNDQGYDEEESILRSRSLWIQAGWHPPIDDPIQF